MESNTSIPILIPVEPEVFWQQIRAIIREEVANSGKPGVLSEVATSGIGRKSLYKISDICKLFEVSRPTIYEWIKLGKLKPFKIRSRVFFLQSDVVKLMEGAG